MATVDISKGKATVTPKVLEKGVNRLISRISISATTSVGDVIRFAKLPHGAQVTGVVFFPGTAYVNNSIFKVGYSASQDAFFASDTYSAAQRVELGSSVKISLSDEAIQRYEYATLVTAAALTVGYAMDITIDYVFDDAGL